MKITIAIDSFKGSLTSMEAGTAAMEGVKAAFPDASVYVRPLADGGEGTVEALVDGMGGRIQCVTVTGPLGDPVECSYCIIEKEKTAIIEMSGAAGITLIPAARRNPLYTTTYGVGETIKDALKKGCRKFIIGIGGSATNDGGIGMLQALGYGFYDAAGNEAPYGAAGLEKLAVIEDKNAMPELKESEFFVACDVTNPLCGENGCSAIYGPQKGAGPEMVEIMDGWMQKYAELAEKRSGRRTRLCIFDFSECCFGAGDFYCAPGDKSGTICKGFGSCYYRRRPPGWTDGNGKGTGRCCRAGEKI